MAVNIAETFELLFDKNNKVAYKALQELQNESEQTADVYPYMDKMGDMLDSDNSYIRTRGLTLLAYNAKWDENNKIDEVIDEYLKHITDIKPITARQCIKLLPVIAKYKPELRNDIILALHKADISFYDDRLLVKPVKSAINYMPDAEYEVPYEGAKEMLLVDDVDSKDYLVELFNVMFEDLPKPKPKSKKKK